MENKKLVMFRVGDIARMIGMPKNLRDGLMKNGQLCDVVNVEQCKQNDGYQFVTVQRDGVKYTYLNTYFELIKRIKRNRGDRIRAMNNLQLSIQMGEFTGTDPQEWKKYFDMDIDAEVEVEDEK